MNGSTSPNPKGRRRTSSSGGGSGIGGLTKPLSIGSPHSPSVGFMMNTDSSEVKSKVLSDDGKKGRRAQAQEAKGFSAEDPETLEPAEAAQALAAKKLAAANEDAIAIAEGFEALTAGLNDMCTSKIAQIGDRIEELSTAVTDLDSVVGPMRALVTAKAPPTPPKQKMHAQPPLLSTDPMVTFLRSGESQFYKTHAALAAAVTSDAKGRAEAEVEGAAEARAAVEGGDGGGTAGADGATEGAAVEHAKPKVASEGMGPIHRVLTDMVLVLKSVDDANTEVYEKQSKVEAVMYELSVLKLKCRDTYTIVRRSSEKVIEGGSLEI